MTSGKPALLLVCTKSWGTIDWVLPVLHAVRQRGLADVYVYFRKNELRSADRYRDLAGLLAETAEVLEPDRLLAGLSGPARFRLTARDCWHRVREGLAAGGSLRARLREACRAPVTEPLLIPLLLDRLCNVRVQYLVHDWPLDCQPSLYDAFPDARVFVVPHGTNSLEERTDDVVQRQRFLRKGAALLERLPAGAVWLTGRAADVKHLRQVGLRCDVAPCGHPKLDPSWIATLRDRARPLHQAGRLTVLFLFMRTDKPTDQGGFRGLVRSVYRLAARHELRLLAKFHPAEPQARVEAFLQGARGVDLAVGDTSALGAAAAADLVIAFPSSAVMDAIAAGTPVVEFFDYTNQRYISFVTEGGRTTSIYRKEGLVHAADSEAELDLLLTRARHEPGFLVKLRERQQAALTRLVGSRDGVIDRILALMQGQGARAA